METSPLNLAHTHARNAAQETRRDNPVAASEEHDLAAAEFATAAAGTTDREALRVLRLLEQHHKQLADKLKDAHTRHTTHGDEKQHLESATGEKVSSSSVQPPRLTQTTRTTTRDLSTSIASNLATKRGIPNTRQKRTAPVSPSVSNEYAGGAFTADRHAEKDADADSISQMHRPSWAPPVTTSQATTQSQANPNSPFQQFYNKFEGVISTLTAPLAFTSLPLSQPVETPKEKAKDAAVAQSPRKVSSKSNPVPASLDYSQLVSSAAWRAVRDNDARYPKPHESFLLVPTSGGTMSYADITAAHHVEREYARQRQHERGLSNASDDFVDASSQILPGGSQNKANTSGSRFKAETFSNGSTAEELILQNKTLTETLNKFAKRLNAFESSAQEMRLAQSRLSLNPSPMSTPENSRGKMLPVSGGRSNDNGLRLAHQRITELEEAIKARDKKLSDRKEEIAKLRDTLNKYREKWEGLKAGAKARRENAGGGERLKRGSSAATAAAAVLSPASSKDKESSSAQDVPDAT